MLTPYPLISDLIMACVMDMLTTERLLETLSRISGMVDPTTIPDYRLAKMALFSYLNTINFSADLSAFRQIW